MWIDKTRRSKSTGTRDGIGHGRAHTYRQAGLPQRPDNVQRVQLVAVEN
jgi:hypothetical protein